eukprot:m.78735 g.78735  ORF g.78735 m.78735 type:complete len:325 (+) comp9241_c1_seq1:305-1279(+)
MTDKEEPRVKNLQGLLKWSTAQEGAGPAAIEGPKGTSLDPERREFLAKVLASLSVNVIDEIQSIFEIVKAPGTSEEDLKNKVMALDRLCDLIEDVDNALDFMKIGGVGICYSALKSDHEPMQCSALECLAIAAQNNPQVQLHLHKTELLERLNKILVSPSKEPGSATGIHTRAIHALSCEIRGQPTLVQAWAEGDGPKALAQLATSVKAPSTRFMVKIANMLANVPDDFPPVCDVVVTSGLVEALVGFLELPDLDDSVWEHTTRSLLVLAQGSRDCVSVLVDKGVANTLQKRVDAVAGRSADEQEGLEEEKLYTSQLLALLTAA